MEKKFENVIYGQTLKEFRKKNNLTQDKVAQLTGLESKYISQIECGIAKGTISTMLKFCNAYNVTPNDVLHKFLNADTNNKPKELELKFSQLSKRDKEIVFAMIDILLTK